MCQLKSCLVLKDRVYCPDYDSHQDMLDKLGIKDDYLGASKTFVRVELFPPDGIRSLMDPLDMWTLKVDQDVTPEWWDAEADRQRVEEAIEAWRGEHVFTEGEHRVEAGNVFAYDNATVKAYDSATVEAYDSATVIAHDSATVTAYVNATVIACDSSTVKAWGSATVEAYDRATVKACDSATVTAYGSATVEAYNSAKVKAFDNATVEAYGSATVKACDSAIVVYPYKKKIVYPAGWTAETHD